MNDPRDPTRDPRRCICRECGYDLTTPVSEACPECGASVAEARIPAPPRAGVWLKLGLVWVAAQFIGAGGLVAWSLREWIWRAPLWVSALQGVVVLGFIAGLWGVVAGVRASERRAMRVAIMMLSALMFGLFVIGGSLLEDASRLPGTGRGRIGAGLLVVAAVDAAVVLVFTRRYRWLTGRGLGKGRHGT